MGFWASYVSAFRRYGDFQGRTSRGVFWRFFAVNLGISLGLLVAGALIIAATASTSTGYYEDESSSPAGYIFVTLWLLYVLAALIPQLAIQARRLHDVGRSGWWLLLGLLGIFGLIPLFIWWAREATGPNAWGPGGPGVDTKSDEPRVSPPAGLASATSPPEPPRATSARAGDQGVALDDVLDRPPPPPVGPTPVNIPSSGPSALDALMGADHGGSTMDGDSESTADVSAGAGQSTDPAHQALRDMIDKRTGSS